MKSPKVLIAIAVTFLALLSQAAAQQATIQVKIPHSFTVAHTTMPAGEYRMSINGSLLRVLRVDGTEAAHTITNFTGGNSNEDLSPKLVFHSYGDRSFLSQVWLGEANMGHELYATPEEVQLARSTKQEVVTLAAVKSPK